MFRLADAGFAAQAAAEFDRCSGTEHATPKATMTAASGRAVSVHLLRMADKNTEGRLFIP